jgi:hypothetical protein
MYRTVPRTTCPHQPAQIQAPISCPARAPSIPACQESCTCKSLGGRLTWSVLLAALSLLFSHLYGVSFFWPGGTRGWTDKQLLACASFSCSLLFLVSPPSGNFLFLSSSLSINREYGTCVFGGYDSADLFSLSPFGERYSHHIIPLLPRHLISSKLYATRRTLFPIHLPDQHHGRPSASQRRGTFLRLPQCMSPVFPPPPHIFPINQPTSPPATILQSITSANNPQHLASYPVIFDSLTTLKTNPYLSKPISLTTSSLSHLTPLLPYIRKPLSYAQPYISRADSLGDSTLSSLETRFPVVKKPTGEIYNEGKEIVFFPLKVGSEGREYVLGVWGSERKKEEGGVFGLGRAVIATGFVVGGEVVGWVSGYFGGKKEEVKGEK